MTSMAVTYSRMQALRWRTDLNRPKVVIRVIAIATSLLNGNRPLAYNRPSAYTWTIYDPGIAAMAFTKSAELTPQVPVQLVPISYNLTNAEKRALCP